MTREMVGKRRSGRGSGFELVGGGIVIALLLYRATLGVSFYDDTYYVTVAWRLAKGARLFADEMALQASGQLFTTAFTWVWLRLVGTTGIMLAARIFYVVVAGLGALAIYRILARYVDPRAALLGALLPIVCAPFNILSASYNTVSQLALVLALALGYLTLSTSSRWAAIATGACLGVAAVSYVSLSVEALVFFLMLAILIKRRSLLVWVVLGGVAAVLALLVPVMRGVTVRDVMTTLTWASQNVSGLETPLVKLSRSLNTMASLLGAGTLVPAWILAAVASVPRLPKAIRVGALLLLPLAAASAEIVWALNLPGAARYGHSASMWLAKFTFVTLIPAAFYAARSGSRHLGRLLVLAAPGSVVGMLLIVYSSNAGTASGTFLAGLAPLSVVVVMAWAEMLASLGGDRAMVAAWVMALLPALFVLFALALNDGRPLRLDTTITSGPYAGLRTSASRAQEVAALTAAGDRYVRRSDRVAFLGERTGYLLTGGRPYTTTSWLYLGPSDQSALDYFAVHGGPPDVVFLDDITLEKLKEPSYAEAAKTDPFIRYLLANYRLVDRVARFGVFRMASSH